MTKKLAIVLLALFITGCSIGKVEYSMLTFTGESDNWSAIITEDQRTLTQTDERGHESRKHSNRMKMYIKYIGESVEEIEEVRYEYNTGGGSSGASTGGVDQHGIVLLPGYTGSNSPSVNRDSIIKMKFEWNGLVENLEATFDEGKIPLSIILN
jgi:hypothetical protein